MLRAASLLEVFEKHALQRQAGRPTPAVLVGDDVVKAWLHGWRARGVVRAPVADVVATYLAAEIVRSRLSSRIEARVLAARSAPHGALAERTAHEKAIWTDVTHDALVASGDTETAVLVTNEGGPRAFFAATHVLDNDAPALLLDAGQDVDAAVRAAIAVAEAAPRAHLAIATDRAPWSEWMNAPGRDHAKALLRGCVVELPRAMDDARALAARARETRAAADDDAARSAAERALFEALDAAPQSRGLFALNETINVLFGNRDLEIDLACRSLRIAVEVDGYFHFQDPEAYRRDRRKDVVLQQQGYFVVRVLAEDVTERLAETLALIHRVMETAR